MAFISFSDLRPLTPVTDEISLLNAAPGVDRAKLTDEADRFDLELWGGGHRLSFQTDQIRASTQPISVQPKKRFKRKMPAVLRCPRMEAMNAGRK